MLSFIPYLVILTFACLVANIYWWRPNGELRQQLTNLLDVKNVRTFGVDESGLNFIQMLLLLQWYLFFGLILFTYIDGEFFDDLSNLDTDTLLSLGICIAIPALWFLVQSMLYHWWSYLFQETGRVKILARVYKALHIIAAPIALVVFLLEMAGILSPEYSYILLILIFIIAQIIFILSGIRIFWSGIGTLCFIFVYLCAFKIAPILLILTKLG